MKYGVIFDLDNTLCDTESARVLRESDDPGKWSKIASQYISGFPVNDRITDLVRTLKKAGWQTAVVTSSTDDYCHKVVNHMGLNYGRGNRDIDYFIGYHDVLRHKPQADGYALAYALMDRPDRLLIVGDEKTDYDAYLNLLKYQKNPCYIPDTEICYYQAKWFDVTKDNPSEDGEAFASSPEVLRINLYQKGWLENPLIPYESASWNVERKALENNRNRYYVTLAGTNEPVYTVTVNPDGPSSLYVYRWKQSVNIDDFDQMINDLVHQSGRNVLLITSRQHFYNNDHVSFAINYIYPESYDIVKEFIRLIEKGDEKSSSETDPDDDPYDEDHLRF